MVSGLHATARRKKRRHRTTVMRKVKKMQSDPDFLKEIGRQSKLGAPSGVIDETLVEAIMTCENTKMYFVLFFLYLVGWDILKYDKIFQTFRFLGGVTGFHEI